MRENGFVVTTPYQGISGIAHGGYVAGLFASRAGGPVRVTLRRPPPLDTLLTVEDSRLVDEEGQTVMQAGPPESPRNGLPEASLEEARTREPHPRFEAHPYSECFMCGTSRSDGFGLRVSAPDHDAVATGVWVPTGALLNDGETVGPEFVWAAVDCLTVWAFADRWNDPEWWPALTAQIQVDQTAAVHRDQPYLLAARTVSRKGRKITVDAAIRDAAGDLCAVGRGLWIALPDKP